MTKHVLGVLASGRGSDFQSIIDNVRLNVLQNVKIGVLISNNSGAYAIERARLNGLPSLFIEGLSGKKFISPDAKERAREEFDKKAVKALRDHGVDIVALAGFMQILSPYFLNEYPLQIMNIHPAKDIQKYGGPGMYGHHVHEAVLKAGEKESGCTVHYVTGDVDGGPIILQQTVTVKPSDTPDTLSERVLIYEHTIYSKAIQLHVDGRLKVDGKSVRVDFSGDWEKKWETRERAYIRFQTEELLKEGKRIEDIL
jgi:phosphoribosylglycinamide formyltransferase-1